MANFLERMTVAQGVLNTMTGSEQS